MKIQTLPANAFSLVSRAYHRSRIATILGAILLLALIVLAVYSITLRAKTAGDATTAQIPTVHVSKVSDLSNGGSSFSVVGSVQSDTEANVLTQSGGEITHVYRQLGDVVSAGTIIAEMDNASQRAAVLQAEGGLQSAQAALAKTSGSARPEQLTILQSAAQSARAAAANALLGAYGATDDSVHHTADAMFSNPDTYAPTLNLTVTDSQLPVDLQNGRVALGAILKRERSVNSSITPDSSSAMLHAEIATTETEVRTARSFFDTLITALGKSIATQSVSATNIATYQANASAARSALTGMLSSLSAADAAITAADQNLTVGTTGGASQDVAGAEAGITSAQGGLAAARAALEKTIIRAPISGTINALPISQGNFIGANAPAATIANNHALEIITHVTESDAKRIAVGQSVAISGGASGVITRIAPAIDPLTNAIEVKIGVVGSQSSLTNGQSVTASFAAATNAPVTKAVNATITIPIIAAKITPSGPIVFTVTSSSTLASHPITFGPILGDRVTITSGITSNMQLVTDARGLYDGETVAIALSSAATSTVTR